MKNILIGVLVIGILILGYLFINKGDGAEEIIDIPVGDTADEKDNENSYPPEVTNPPEQDAGEMTTILVPLITQNSMGADFGPFGCGAYLSFVPKQVPQTPAVLNATYKWLFSNPSSFDGGNYFNTIATQTNLDFKSVEIVNGTARVYLTGSVMGAHCGDATFAAQIEQAAFQYPTVSGIEVYVNGEIFDWCDIADADPEESGCDENPKLWNSQRMFEIE